MVKNKRWRKRRASPIIKPHWVIKELPKVHPTEELTEWIQVTEAMKLWPPKGLK